MAMFPVKNNLIRGLQSLFGAGKPSPVDAYPFGHTALSLSQLSLSDGQRIFLLGI